MVMAMDAVIAEALAARKPKLEETIKAARDEIETIDGILAGRLRIQFAPAETLPFESPPKPEKPARVPARKAALQAKRGAARDMILKIVKAEPGIAADALAARVCSKVQICAKDKTKRVRVVIMDLVRGGRITIDDHRHVFPVAEQQPQG
jgi:endonuclease III